MKSFSPIPFNPKPFPGIDVNANLQLSGDGYYLTDETFNSNPSTPMMSSHPSFASGSTMNSTGTSPLWQESPKKIVSKCLNCSYKYYARGKKTDFCSKDCETCYLMFNKSGQYCKNLRSVEEIRKSIFEFQRELDQQNAPTPPPPALVVPQPPMIINPNELSSEEKGEENKEKPAAATAWGLNPATALFNITAILTSPTRKKQQQAMA